MNKKHKNLIPIIILCLVYIFNVYMIFTFSYTNLDSDMSSEMVLAKLMNDHKDIFFCKEWHYSTEIRFIYLQIFYRLGLLIFPNNWIYARTLGSAIALACLALAFLHLGRTLKLERYGIWMTTLLLCPISTIYYKIVGFGNSYVPHLICYILITDLIIMYIREHKPVYMISLILLGLSGGLNGIRILFSYLLPLLTITILLIIAFNKDLSFKDYLNTLFKEYYVVIIETLSIVVGFLINNFYLRKVYNFRNYLGHTLSDLSLNTILERISNYLGLFGYASGNKILSIGAVSSLFCVAFDCILIYFLVISVKNVKKIIKNNDKTYYIFSIGLLISAIEFALVFTVMGEEQINYWIPLVPFTFIGSGIFFKNNEGSINRLLLCLMIISIIGSSLYPVAVTYNTKKDNSNMDTINYLLDNNLTNGYGSFWSGNVLKELSNGKIDIWVNDNILYYNSDYTVFPWLQETNHLKNEPKGEVFFIFNKEMDEIDVSYLEDKKVFESNKYIIFKFDDYTYIKNYMNNRVVE